MNDMYYNDYYNSGFSYEPYPLHNNQQYYCDGCCRSSSSSSMEMSSCSNCSSNSSRVDTFFNPSEGFAKGNMQANTYKPYKLVNPSLPPVSNEKERLLLDVQMYSFAMWDLNLYLNTHPTDRNVMMLFDNYRNSYRRAVNEYENKYGPLHLENVNTSSASWEWNKSPWPWEV